MALGGGTFTVMNKKLPGAYINNVSAANASATLSDRGVLTMPLTLDWGPTQKVFTVEKSDFEKNSMKIFGYAYTDPKMKGLRDLFSNAKTLHAYRLNGGGNAAENDYCTAKYAGERGNSLKIVIRVNADDGQKFDVLTYLDTTEVDNQTVTKAEALEANDYVMFKSNATLKATAGTPLAGGTNSAVDGDAYQKYADLIEAYTYNVMGIVTTDEAIKKLFVSFCKRLRDEMGINFQLVTYQFPKADYIGVISVKNRVTDDGENEGSLVYWVAGAEAGCAVNRSCQNKKYDGEYTVDTHYTQAELINALDAGELVFHGVQDTVRVLDDINTFVSLTDGMGEAFKSNQTIRIIDQLGNDDATLFNSKYLGVMPNNAAGRTSLWSDLVKIRQSLQTIGAIQNFSDTDVTVEQGDSKKSVVATSAIEPVNAMAKLYLTNIIQ